MSVVNVLVILLVIVFGWKVSKARKRECCFV